MFRAIISPILRNCVSSLWCNVPALLPAGDPILVASRQHRRCIIPQAVNTFPDDGRNYRPKHIELIVIINNICYCCIQLAVCIIVSMMLGHKHQICYGRFGTNVRLHLQRSSIVFTAGHLHVGPKLKKTTPYLA